jgi:tetratricopeptide (TPR) repeat protein
MVAQKRIHEKLPMTRLPMTAIIPSPTLDHLSVASRFSVFSSTMLGVPILRHFRAAALTLLALAGAARAATPASEAAFADGQSLMAEKKLPEAAQKFEAAVASDPGYAQAWYALAVVRRRMGECPPAIAAYRRYALLEPDKPEPYYGLGLCLRDTGDKTAAAEALKRYVAIEKDPAAQKWIDNARAILADLGAGPTGAEPASPPAPPPATAPEAGKPAPAAGETPGDRPADKPGERAASPAAASAMAQAQALRDRGEIDAAVAKYQQAIAADPRRLPARVALGELLLQVHRDDEAIDIFRAALERNPSSPQALYDLAFALRVRDRQAEAVDAYQRYVKVRPGDPDAYFGLARALQSLGRKADARKAYETYLSLEKRPSERRWTALAQSQLRMLKGP